MRDKWVYYIAFPLLVIGLCAFSYYLGWNRGKQHAVVSSQDEKPASEGPMKDVHEDAEGDLTFFAKLKESQPEDTPEKIIDIEKKESARKSVPKKTEKKSVQQEKSTGKSELDQVIQISAFKDIGKAHELSAELSNRGYPAFVRSSKAGGEVWHRVFVGPVDTKAEGEDLQSRLKGDGFNSGFLTAVAK